MKNKFHNIMKQFLLSFVGILCVIAYPFRSMLVEVVMAANAPMEDVREGDVIDLAFKFDNDKFYCSELIYYIYLNQLGIKLCNPKKIDDYLILGAHRIPKIKQAMKKRGITMEQYAVAPVDVFNSKELRFMK